jgi:N-methylhydantoinase B
MNQTATKTRPGDLRRKIRPRQQVELRNTVIREVGHQSAKFSGLYTNIGDTITYYSPVGGGYGAPLDRDPRKVLDDVLDGFITVGHARDDYGVVLSEVVDGYGWALNREATRKLRTEMARLSGLRKSSSGTTQ